MSKSARIKPFEIFVGLTYASTWIAVPLILDSVELDALFRVALALVPAIVTCVFILVLVRRLRRFDELQKRILIAGYTIAFAGIAVFTVTYGMLEVADIGLPRLPMMTVFGLLILLQMMGVFIASRRYQ